MVKIIHTVMIFFLGFAVALICIAVPAWNQVFHFKADAMSGWTYACRNAGASGAVYTDEHQWVCVSPALGGSRE